MAEQPLTRCSSLPGSLPAAHGILPLLSARGQPFRVCTPHSAACLFFLKLALKESRKQCALGSRACLCVWGWGWLLRCFISTGSSQKIVTIVIYWVLVISLLTKLFLRQDARNFPGQAMFRFPPNAQAKTESDRISTGSQTQEGLNQGTTVVPSTVPLSQVSPAW